MHGSGQSGCISFERKTERFTLTMTVVRMGRDLCVGLFGGDAPHIGAVALAVALAVPHAGAGGEPKATASLLSVDGHKEGELAQKIAQTLAARRRCRVSVSCGIHLDNATEKEIDDVLHEAGCLLDEAIEGTTT